MKFSLKMFCIALISAGLVLSACERKEEAADEEAAAEETEEALEEEADAEEEPAEEEAADEADTGAEEADAAADEDAGEDAGQEAAADKPAEEKKQAAKPKTPPVTGTLSGNVGGSGITNGSLKLMIEDDYDVKGSFTGKREDARFVIPLQGSISKSSNAISLKGSRGSNEARLTGNVTKAGVSGKLSGKIHEKSFSSNISVSK